MASSGNFMTFNALAFLNSYSASYSKLDTQNLRGKATAGGWGRSGNFSFDSGKWYCEFYIYRRSGSSIGYVAVVDQYYPHIDAKYNDNRHRQPTVADYTVYYIGSGVDGTATNTHIINNQTNGSNPSQTFANSRWEDGDVVAIALDLDSSPQTVQFYKNGSAVGNAENLNASASGTWAFWGGSHNQTWFTMNAGQDSTFAGNKTAQGNTDDNGFGDFYYSPPSGFLACCTANLPISADIDPAQTDDDYPSKQFGVVAYSGNSSSQSIDLGFQPDLIWTKIRVASDSRIVDSTRGASKSLISNKTNAEETYVNGVTGFTSTGYTLSTDALYNGSAYTYVAWCWRANGGTTVTNTDGDITSLVQSNTKAGFSIVTYSGTLSGAGTASVGHGLTKKPDFLISKARTTNNDNGNWHCSHVGLTNFNYRIRLNQDEAQADRSSSGDMASLFTNSTFGTNYTSGLNVSGDTYVAYVWHNVDGMQRFGKYTGTGSSDGQFIYLGFRPSLIFLKNIEASSSWLVHDDKRDTENPVNEILLWNTGDAEFESGDRVNFLSNGFKLLNSNAGMNGSGTQYVYGAWASTPFRYNNSF